MSGIEENEQTVSFDPVEEETETFSFDPIDVEEIAVEEDVTPEAEEEKERVPQEYTINTNIDAQDLESLLAKVSAAATETNQKPPNMFDSDEINKKLKEKNIKYNFNELMDNFFDNFMNKKTSDDDFLKNIMALKDNNNVEELRKLFAKDGESVYNDKTETAAAEAGIEVDMNVD